MQKREVMREVGVIKAPPLMRFGRNQRRAALLAPAGPATSGVVRFKTWQDFTQWRKLTRRLD
jgi:hypothetical protein